MRFVESSSLSPANAGSTTVTGWRGEHQLKKLPAVLAGGSLGALILGSEMSSTRRSLGRSTMR